jgi:four helix bundle protein
MLKMDGPPPDFAERLLNYTAKIVKAAEALPSNLVGRRVGQQLLRSGMAVGAHYEEAQEAESREEFVRKLQIAVKELRKSNYWLRLLIKAGILPGGHLADLVNESEQLRVILSKAVAETKG